MDARQTRFGPKDLKVIFKDATKVRVARGRKVVDLDLKGSPGDRAQLETLVIGPSGNLRAPAIRMGKTWIVGFEEGMYAEAFG